jgi:sulfatase maturation enzyme AslB (radical SAM superfamily)
MAKIQALVGERRPLHELLPLEQPLGVYIGTNFSCNFSCQFCYQAKIHSAKDAVYGGHNF